MDLISHYDTPLFTWVIIPLLIFSARVIDVTLGTFRIIFVARGMKYLAAGVGFFEIIIWLLAIGQILQNLTNVMCYIAYGGGFACGNFLGIYIADKISLGKVIIRIITPQDTSKLMGFFRKQNYGVTVLDAMGGEGPVKIIFSVLKKNDLPFVIDNIKTLNPKAFYSVEDITYVSQGIFPNKAQLFKPLFPELFRTLRKGK